MNYDFFKVLSFDCYGTLIDWEKGILTALQSVLSRAGVTINEEKLLESYGELESAEEVGPYIDYKTVLRNVLDELEKRFGFVPLEEELIKFSQSVGDWPPFEDSSEALQKLRSKYRLAILSNVDDDLFTKSAAKLEVMFDFVVTAQQVRAYKHSRRNFEELLNAIDVLPKHLLHVAQNCYHNIAPARKLGLQTVWINRRWGKKSSGAILPGNAKPDAEFHDLTSLASTAIG